MASYRVKNIQFKRGFNGIQKEIINQIGNNPYKIFKIIDNNNNHYFGIVKNEDDVLELIKENHALHEIIYTYPRRVYFDIDINPKENPNFNLFSLIQLIKVHISKDEINIYGYENDEKKSYHITLSNTYIENDEQRLKFKKYLIYLKNKYPVDFGACGSSDEIIDTRVYGITQAFKCIHQGKINKPIGGFIKDCPIRDIKNTFVSLFIGEIKFNLFENQGNPLEYQTFISLADTVDFSIPKINNQQKEQFKITVEKTNIIDSFDFNDINNPIKLLNICPVYNNGLDLGHSHRFRVMLFCYYNNINFNQYIEWFINGSKLNNIDNETIERRIIKLKYSWDNQLLNTEKFKISIDSFKKYLSNFYPSIFSLENHATRNFLNSFNIPNDIKTVNIDDYLDIKHIENKEKYIIASLCLGGGKTTTTLKYLNENPNKSFIWLAPRQTLVLNTAERMRKEFNIKVVHHLEIGTNKKKLKESNGTLICNQSLIYIDDNKKYNVVVIDEIETVLNSWSDDETHKDKLETNFISFCKLIKNADKVILLDAYITTKTINFINSLGDKNDQIMLFTSNKKPKIKQMIENKDYLETINKISNDIINNKKIYIFYPYKTSKENRDGILDLDERIKKTVQDIKYNNAQDDKERIDILKNQKLKSLVYFAESREKNKLGDVNEKWKEADYIITNTSITVGVNYEGLDYDKIYIFISGTCSNPRDILQTSMRIRKTKEDIIELYFFDTLNKNFLKYPKYYIDSNDTIYKNLIKNVFEEFHADFIDSLKKFCELTDYNFSNCETLVKRTYNKKNEFINDLYDSKMLIEYSNIPDINETEKENLENKIFSRDASLLERLTVDKYYFDNHFYHFNYNEKLFIWNNRGRQFFKNINHPIIKFIMKDNNINNLNDLNLNKIILSSSTIDNIYNNFSIIEKTKSNIKLINKLFYNLLNVDAVDAIKKSNNKIQSYQFSDVFITLSTMYYKYNKDIEFI